ncbi:hypothetical protein [Streptomyces olivaceus]|uniref:hypothetical protein n=1 Tax=Streptomyces olivaceus TaxID=47716 RepID=UPI001D17B4FD|nr:hypothetical protein [Streptomyces olivaceus]
MSHTSPPADPVTTTRLAASWSDWAGDHTAALIGIPLRIAVIVVILLVVRAVAKRAITRVVQRVLEPSAGETERSRPAGRPAAPPSCTATVPGRGSDGSSAPAPSARCSAAP